MNATEQRSVGSDRNQRTAWPRTEFGAPARKIYFATFAGLIALLLLTVVASRLHLGPLNPVIALTIAVAKMLLIILFFMHVRYSARLTWVFVIAGFFWLGILVVLAMGDYLTRGWG